MNTKGKPKAIVIGADNIKDILNTGADSLAEFDEYADQIVAYINGLCFMLQSPECAECPTRVHCAVKNGVKTGLLMGKGMLPEGIPDRQAYVAMASGQVQV